MWTHKEIVDLTRLTNSSFSSSRNADTTGNGRDGENCSEKRTVESLIIFVNLVVAGTRPGS